MKDCDSLFLENLYSQLILEKDHRQKMISFGIPQDVADYLHNFNDKYSLWFADKIKKMQGFTNTTNKINWIQVHLLTQMQGIMDWVRNTPNINLKKYSWDEAVQSQNEYHEKLQVSTIEGRETKKIIKKYNDGFYWVDLESSKDCTEQSLMGHCASTRKGDTLWSLRKYTPETQTIEAFITIAVSPEENTWYQCKGKKNSRPKEEYYKYISDILYSKNIYIFKSEYNAGADFKNSDLKNYIENHPNEFPNSEAFLEKIDESSITFEDFEKELDKHEFSTISMYIDEDYGGEDEAISVSYNFSIDFKYSDFKIPDIKNIIEENEGEYSGWGETKKAGEALKDVLYDHEIYTDEIRIDADSDGQGFSISCYLRSDDDTYYEMTDNGLSAFGQQCSYIADQGRTIENNKDDFAEDLEKGMLKAGWYSTPYTEFINGIVDDVEEGRFKKLKATITKKLDVDLNFEEFDNPLLKYKTQVSINLSKFSFFDTERVSEDALKLYPFLHYLYDFFGYVLNEYLKRENPEILYLGKEDTQSGPKLAFVGKLYYEYQKDYNPEKILKMYHALDNSYDNIIRIFYKFCQEIVDPNIREFEPLKIEDVWYDPKKIEEIDKKKKEAEEKDGYYYGDTVNLYWIKNKNELVDLPIYFTYSGKGDIKDLVEDAIKNTKTYPDYIETVSRNFLEENFGHQMTFKEYFKRKKIKSDF